MARGTSEPQRPERSRGVGTSMGRVTDPRYLRSRIADSSGPAGHNPGALYCAPYLGHMGQSRESCRPDKDDRNTTGGPTRERPPNGPRSMKAVDDSPRTDMSRNARVFKLYINGADAPRMSTGYRTPRRTGQPAGRAGKPSAMAHR